MSIDLLREISHLNLLAEQKLKGHGLSGIEDDAVAGTRIGSGLKLKGKRSGLDIVKHDCAVMCTQRCSHTHLKNEYAASNMKYRDLDLRLVVVAKMAIIANTTDEVE